ncbi:unnamed protein product [Parnassius mnemosyne]|uniref:Ima1 N-terminal domain-containing protein n=1 Tax=Parnassius mnemosyne TaxID=213953 RepID=A0AAV1KES8_9NEOP
MKFHYKIELALITITAILCIVLLFKLLHRLRTALPWRVNCWFCNCNIWVKFPIRNCWICPKCEQYNGFTEDGDYNRVLNVTTEQTCKIPKVFQKSSPKNGLCKMCNINQHLKVTQLANFVPMNEKKFDEEIESYRLQLEKAYKLCSPCKKVLQTKLHKEKETFLGSKLLETRTPEKKQQKQLEKQSQILRNLINGSSTLIAGILFVLVAFEFLSNIEKHKNLLNTVYNIRNILLGLFERIITIVKMKTFMTFPSLESNFYDMHNIENMDMFKNFNTGYLNSVNDLTQKALGGFVCFIQIVGHVWNINKLNYSIVVDLLWSVFAATSIAHNSVTLEPILMTSVKLSSILGLMLVYRKMQTKTVRTTLKIQLTPKKVKNLANGTMNSLSDDEDNLSLDTDDDVSLSKFGLHNFTDSSNETLRPLSNSLNNGRSFTPRTESVWGKPKLNSTFCVNSVIAKSPSSVSETVFRKPSFNKYQNLVKSDSDSELDESISTLSIGPKNRNVTKNPVFGIRKFNATPSFITPTPLGRTRPLISPSKLGHSTSWVAGGYWGSEGERQIFSINGSRSSSQSSGFESQTSSMNQRNLFSQPSSREDSICGEPDRNSLLLDRFQNCSTSNYCFQNASNFTPISSPVFPQMQFNSHVQIPQPRLAQQTFVSQNVFTQPQPFTQNSMFKTPGGSGLIKLPQDNSFTLR